MLLGKYTIVGRDYLNPEQVGYDGGCCLTYQLDRGFFGDLLGIQKFQNKTETYVKQQVGSRTLEDGSVMPIYNWWLVQDEHLFKPVRDEDTLNILEPNRGEPDEPRKG